MSYIHRLIISDSMSNIFGLTNGSCTALSRMTSIVENGHWRPSSFANICNAQLEEIIQLVILSRISRLSSVSSFFAESSAITTSRTFYTSPEMCSKKNKKNKTTKRITILKNKERGKEKKPQICLAKICHYSSTLQY